MFKTPTRRALTVAGACFLGIVPFLIYGNPSGHDFEFHMFSWMEVLGQWKLGIIYPRWAAMAHWGYGEARFLFYPPASWTLGAALGAVLPWKVVPGVYCWLALTLAGASMYRLARVWLPARGALFAALFYALNPYSLLVIYWRSAFAELLAAPLLPVIVLCLLRIYGLADEREGYRPALWLSLALAAAWLTNAPAALMIHYSTAGLALFLAARDFYLNRSWRRVVRPLGAITGAIVLGAGIAAVYLIPAVYEQNWINLSEVMAPGVRPQDNFLFTNTGDADHNRFNLLVSILAVAEIAALAATIAGWKMGRPDKSRPLSAIAGKTGGEQTPRMLLSAWAAASAFLMISVSNLLWVHLPKFRFIQLPFRWLLCMNAALAVLLVVRFRWALRYACWAALVAVLIIAGHRIQPPWWDGPGDIREMKDAMSDGIGNEGIDEYVPAGDDPYELDKNLPRVVDSSGRAVRSDVLKWTPTEKHFSVNSSGAQELTVRLLSYPAWDVQVNGNTVETGKTDVTGLVVIPVGAGESDVRILFRRTVDRLAGDIVSLISIGLFIVAWIINEAQRAENKTMTRRILVASSNPGKLGDFAGAAALLDIEVVNLPDFASLPLVIEDGVTFEENARKKAESYSRAAPGELVIADDSGLEIDELGGAPGVHSARYAADDPLTADANSNDDDNNLKVLRELEGVPRDKRTARFVCVLAVARDGMTMQTFRGTAEGIILEGPRGTNGFGYDPLFLFPRLQKTFAELSAEEKSRYSHRGAAFRKLLAWMDSERASR